MGLAWHALLPSLQTPLLHWSVNAEQFRVAPPVHTPPWHASPTLQKRPSSHALPFGSARLQAFPASLQLSAQFPSPSAPGQGLPECVVHPPTASHLSVPLQNVESSQAVFEARFVHVPAVAGLTLHDLQSLVPPAHAVVQHTPSTHVSAVGDWLHIDCFVHPMPVPTLVLQLPVGTSQYWVDVHWLSSVHAPRHALPLQAPELQMIGVC